MPASFSQLVKALKFNNQTYEPGAVDFSNVGDTCVYIGFRYIMPVGTPGTGVSLNDIRLKATYYSDSANVALDPGQLQPVGFTSWAAGTGHYVARCSLYQSGDKNPDNNAEAREFRVKSPEPAADSLGATGNPVLVRTFPKPTAGILNIVGWHGPGRARVFDVAGRYVTSCMLSDRSQIDASALKTGVYLLYLDWPGSAPATSRFVVAR